MRKLFLALVILSMLFVGCSLPTASRRGVTPAGIMTDVNYNSDFGGSTRFNIESQGKYKILGPVSAVGESINVLGLIAQGDNGYKKILDAARKIGGNAVINLTTDVHYNYYVLGIYQRVTTKLYGIAVKLPTNKLNFNPQKPILMPQTYYTPPVPKSLPIQPTVAKIDLNKNFFIIIEGQKYGPVNIKQIKDLKKMGYCNDESDLIDPSTNQTFKVKQILN